MNTNEQQQAVASAFQSRFGTPPEVTAYAPGRVNLLGEHTDYNGGYVLPMALAGLGVAVALAPGPKPGMIEAYSSTLDQTDQRDIGESAAGRWSDYLLGSLKAMAGAEIRETGLRAALITTLPMGAGLSSSAALEVASLRAAATLFGKSANPVQIALMARAVENDFVGMPCGIMDQFASSVGQPGAALFLNTRTLEYRPAPSLPKHRFVIFHSGVSHQLTDNSYATRVAECAAARAALGVASLSDLGAQDLATVDALPEPLNRRARHIITDNRLTQEGLAALQAGDADCFGRLMIDSHASQRDNYQITVPETNALAHAAVELGALGARQTGGGWGGSVVALLPQSRVVSWIAEMESKFPNATYLSTS